MIFLNIHIAICILFLVVLTLSTLDTSYEFKKLYPGLKAPKKHWSRQILTYIKTIIIAIIPIWNLIMCWTMLFKYDEIKDKTINEIYLECTKEKENVTHLSETSER